VVQAKRAPTPIVGDADGRTCFLRVALVYKPFIKYLPVGRQGRDLGRFSQLRTREYPEESGQHGASEHIVLGG
jgi:hypothetical protein